MKTKVNFTEKEKQMKCYMQPAYLLDCIENSGKASDENITFANDAEKVAFFFNTFIEEFNTPYNKKLFRNLSERIGNYLQGLPSCIALPYCNDEIIEQGKKWGFCKTEKRAAEFCGNWFKVCGTHLQRLANIFGYDLNGVY